MANINLQKLSNELIYKNFSKILSNKQNDSSELVLEMNKLFDDRNTKEIFHHAKSYEDYGQDIRNKINGAFLKAKENFRTDIKDEIIKNDNKVSFKIIRAFAALHDLKCALICTLIEVSLFFIVATLIHCKGQFDFGKVWNDIVDEFKDRPWQSWLILFCLIIFIILVTFVIPNLVNHYVCKPYLQKSEGLTYAQKLYDSDLYQKILERQKINEASPQELNKTEELSLNDENTDNVSLDENNIALINFYQATINSSGIISNVEQSGGELLTTIKNINDQNISYFKKIELIDTFLWKGYYKDNNSVNYNPIFKKYNLKVNLSFTLSELIVGSRQNNPSIQRTTA